MTETKSPTAGKMAVNLTLAAKDIVKSGFKRVSSEEYANRMSICNQCEFWDGKARFGLGKCNKCGCTGAKQWFATSKCPIDKWGALA